MESLNRFCLAFGLLALAAGGLMTYASSQLVAENKRLNEKVKTLMQRSRPEFVPKYQGKDLLMMIPSDVAINGRVDWVNIQNQTRSMPHAVDD